MNLPLVSSKVEICSVIRYFTARGEDTTAIYWNITKVYGNKTSVEMVHRRLKQFLDSQTDVSNEQHGGRPSKINTITINTVRFLIGDDWHQTVDEVEHYFKEVECDSLSHGTIVKSFMKNWKCRTFVCAGCQSCWGKICLHESQRVVKNGCITTSLR